MTTLPIKTDSIIIVGAGIFGLGTAIHLARRGYTDVTDFGKQPYEKTLYSYIKGCDAASAGFVIILKIAPESSPLHQRLSPSGFPLYMFIIRQGAEGSIYGFTVDGHGYLKISYRGTKYTDQRVQANVRERSEPFTRWAEKEQIPKIPEKAMRVLRKFLSEYLPNPEAEGIDTWLTRLCWYNDSFGNQ